MASSLSSQSWFGPSIHTHKAWSRISSPILLRSHVFKSFVPQWLLLLVGQGLVKPCKQDLRRQF